MPLGYVMVKLSTTKNKINTKRLEITKARILISRV
jgi:hypothetical protein